MTAQTNIRDWIRVQDYRGWTIASKQFGKRATTCYKGFHSTAESASYYTLDDCKSAIDLVEDCYA